MPETPNPLPSSATAPRSPTARTAPPRAACSRRSASRRGPGQADHRRRHDLDRDDAVQLQPAPAGRARQGGHPRRRRHADGVQHDRRLRRRHDGHRGHEGLASSAARSSPTRSSCRPRPPVRRHRLPGRLRQDDPRRDHGPRPARHPGRDPLQRHDLSGHVQGQARRHDRHDLRGDRRLPGRQDERRGAVRDRVGQLPRRRARAAASTRPTRCRWCSRSWASPRPGSTASRPSIPTRTRPPPLRRDRDGPRPARRPPKDFVTRKSIENAIACVAATGGSTNGVLHLLAIAHEYGIPLDIDEFGEIADRTPIVGDLSPAAASTPPPTSTTPAASRSSPASCSSGT
jgi:hypothetical protein